MLMLSASRNFRRSGRRRASPALGLWGMLAHRAELCSHCKEPGFLCLRLHQCPVRPSQGRPPAARRARALELFLDEKEL